MFAHSTHPLISIVLATFVALSIMIGGVHGQDARDTIDVQQLAINPHRVAGHEACEKCHANEIAVWKRTPHSETFFTLHRQLEAQEIASRLGIQSFKTNDKCVNCHYTVQHSENEMRAISGVSCESCHGAAKDWINVHSDYGGPNATKDSETAEHRQQRLVASVRNGMRNPVNLYMVAQSCYGCHTVPDEELVNVGGHNVGSLDFELVSWSQGSLRHNFLRNGGQSNAVESPEKLRVIFVCGMIADLEYSMRATAVAKEKDKFGMTNAKRTERSAKRLASVYKKTRLPILADIVRIYSGVSLKLNNEAQLTAAADKIKKLGLQFAGTVNGSELKEIEKFVPDESKWR